MKTRNSTRSKTISELFEEHTEIDRAAREGVRQALLRHKMLGQSIAVWENGKVVCIPAERIKVEPEALSIEDPAPKKAG
jgi:hypothetical protein